MVVLIKIVVKIRILNHEKNLVVGAVVSGLLLSVGALGFAWEEQQKGVTSANFDNMVSSVKEGQIAEGQKLMFFPDGLRVDFVKDLSGSDYFLDDDDRIKLRSQ